MLSRVVLQGVFFGRLSAAEVLTGVHPPMSSALDSCFDRHWQELVRGALQGAQIHMGAVIFSVTIFPEGGALFFTGASR